MFEWVKKKWHERQRRIDLAVLWPACKEQAPDIDRAKAAFAMHAFHDSAWLALGREEVTRRIDSLA